MKWFWSKPKEKKQEWYMICHNCGWRETNEERITECPYCGTKEKE